MMVPHCESHYLAARVSVANRNELVLQPEDRVNQSSLYYDYYCVSFLSVSAVVGSRLGPISSFPQEVYWRHTRLLPDLNGGR